MKFILIGILILIALAVAGFALFAGSLGYRTNQVSKSVDSFEKEFQPGNSVDSLIDRALEIGAAEFILSPSEGLSKNYDKNLPGVGRNQPEHLVEIRELSQSNPRYDLKIVIPGFLNARWVIDVKTENRKVTSISSRYIN